MTINPNDISVWFYDDSDLAISPSDHVTGLRRELLLRRISQQFGERIMGDAEPVFGLDHRCVWVERAGFEHGIALVERGDRLRSMARAFGLRTSVGDALQTAAFRMLDAGLDALRSVAAARLNGPDEPDVCPRWSAHFGCYYEATCEIPDGERELRREIGLVFTVREE